MDPVANEKRELYIMWMNQRMRSETPRGNNLYERARLEEEEK